MTAEPRPKRTDEEVVSGPGAVRAGEKVTALVVGTGAESPGVEANRRRLRAANARAGYLGLVAVPNLVELPFAQPPDGLLPPAA